MAAGTGLAKLLMEIEAQRQRADHAQRLARLMTNAPERDNLLAYAGELDKEVEKLEAQLAVMRQSAAETAQATEPEQSIAAVKPPPRANDHRA